MATRRVRGSDVSLSTRIPLFTRFETGEDAGLDDLARDLADILGSRRVLPHRVPGILNWGLPGISGVSPNSHKDRVRVAGLVAQVIEQFEPRLEQVRVVPDDDMTDFNFHIEAELVRPDENQSITLRVLSPRRGGGLSAEVQVIGE